MFSLGGLRSRVWSIRLRNFVTLGIGAWGVPYPGPGMSAVRSWSVRSALKLPPASAVALTSTEKGFTFGSSPGFRASHQPETRPDFRLLRQPRLWHLLGDIQKKTTSLRRLPPSTHSPHQREDTSSIPAPPNPHNTLQTSLFKPSNHSSNISPAGSPFEAMIPPWCADVMSIATVSSPSTSSWSRFRVWI